MALFSLNFDGISSMISKRREANVHDGPLGQGGKGPGKLSPEFQSPQLPGYYARRKREDSIVGHRSYGFPHHPPIEDPS